MTILTKIASDCNFQLLHNIQLAEDFTQLSFRKQMTLNEVHAMLENNYR